jgi:hypothetical protein
MSYTSGMWNQRRSYKKTLRTGLAARESLDRVFGEEADAHGDE